MKKNLIAFITTVVFTLGPVTAMAATAPKCKPFSEFSCEIIFPIPIPICKVKAGVVCS